MQHCPFASNKATNATIANKYLSIVFTNYNLFVSTGDKYREKTRNAKINPPLFNNICKATSTPIKAIHHPKD